MKRTFSILLIMAMLLATVPFNALALTEGDWEYKILNNEIIITRYNGSDTEVVVPSTIKGCPVVSLTLDKNSPKLSIKKIILPNGLRQLDENALAGCANLEYVEIPASLKKIGRGAFYGCRKLKSIDLSYVETMEEEAFTECKELTEVILSNKLMAIPDRAFYRTNLKHIDIPKSIKKIGIAAFSETALESVIIPGTVETIESASFSSCLKLKRVIIGYGTKTLNYNKYNAGQIAHGTFSYCSALEEVYIPSTAIRMISSFVQSDYSPNAVVYCKAGSYAEQVCQENEISYLIDNSVDTRVNVLNNGSRISFHKYGQNPIIENGRTLIPLRAIFEALNAKVDWDGTTRTVTATKGDTKISLQIGSNKMYVNGQVKTLDVPAKIINGSTLVPARAVAEAFNCNVGWDDNSKTVFITE